MPPMMQIRIRTTVKSTNQPYLLSALFDLNFFQIVIYYIC